MSQNLSTEIPQTSNLSSIQTTASPMVTDYFETALSVFTRGMNYSIQGPCTNVTRSTWQHKINIRTKADDAWADSGINNYTHYAAFVINNSIKFEPTDNGSNYTPVYPPSNGSTSFSFLFYFGSKIGTQLVTVKTSKTTITPGAYSLTDSFAWTPAIAYLDEVDDPYTSNKRSFGAEVNWSTNNTGYRTNNVTVNLQYEVIGKHSEFDPNVYAYPSYSDTSIYGIQVN